MRNVQIEVSPGLLVEQRTSGQRKHDHIPDFYTGIGGMNVGFE